MPEVAACLVYRPRPPALLTLNASAWLLLEILIEQPGRDPWPAFHAAVRHAASKAGARRVLEEGLRRLADLGLIEPAADGATKEEQNDRFQA